ncbi:MAG: family 2A encapsulin nanocompartment cargo protein cysteine desulfurase [Nitrosospira sp.]
MVNEMFSTPPGVERVSANPSGVSSDATPGAGAGVPGSWPSTMPYEVPHSAAASPIRESRVRTKPPFGTPHEVPHSAGSAQALRIPALGVELPYADTFAAFSLPLPPKLNASSALLPFSIMPATNARPSAGTDTLPINPADGSQFYFLDEGMPFGGGARTGQIPVITSAHPAFDANAVRRDFPILRELVHGRPLIWLDNAATTQKPQSVIDRLTYFYQHENSNIHRAAHELAARATDAYEESRGKVRRFLNAPSADEIIFLRGTTEAINLVAQSWGRQNVNEGDEVVITWLEHHANIVPWQQLCNEKGAKLRVAPVDDDGQILLDEYQKLLGSRTKLVSFSHVSNALGTITPARQMIEMAHRVGARVLVDGAQSVSHMRVDVQQLDCDWFVFSGHKVFGPTGIGALFGKAELLNTSPPWQGGGNMIQDVTFEKTAYNAAPARFEAGTGNIADAVGLGAAIDYVERVGIDNISRYEHDLMAYATRGLNTVPGLRLIGTAPDKAGVLSFALKGFATEEVGGALNREGIAVRAGHHCAQPILRRFGYESTVRPSLALYNTYADVDTLVAALHRLQGGRYNY